MTLSAHGCEVTIVRVFMDSWTKNIIYYYAQCIQRQLTIETCHATSSFVFAFLLSKNLRCEKSTLIFGYEFELMVINCFKKRMINN